MSTTMENIKINRNDLVHVMYDGCVFAGKSKYMPVLDNVCITTKGNRIRIESSDSNNYIRSYGFCDTTADMSFCVNAKELSSYIGLLNEEDITMNYDSDKKQLIIKHANGEINMPTTNASEFPAMRPMKEANKIELSGEVLAEWLTTAGNFAMKGTFGVVLEGIYIYANPEFLGVCGGEHSQIFTARIPNTNNIPDFGIVLPKDSASIMSRICTTSDKVTLMQDESAMYISTDNTIVCSLLLNLKYPNVAFLFNQTGKCHVTIEKSTLLQAVKRIESQTVRDNESIHLHCTGHSIELNYDVIAEYSKRLSESVPCDGDAFDDVIVNIKHLRKVLSNYSGDKVMFHHDNSEGSPFIFENKRDDSLELFLLAVMVNQN